MIILYKKIILLICIILLSCDSDKDIEGCTDIYSCNYNSEATIDNDSCYYSEDGCTRCYPVDPAVCLTYEAPVCGCDNIIYSNPGCALLYVMYTIDSCN